MKIENIKTETLVPYARNAKLHDENQVSKIASSIREFGFNNPVLVDGEKPPGIMAGFWRQRSSALQACRAFAWRT
jgi:ParB-like chromosome segregation protein Spo0J